MTLKRETALQRWGKEFALAREAAGYTQDRLAADAHVSRSVIAKWETGERAPKDLADLARCEARIGTRGLLTRLLKGWVGRETSPEWFDWLAVEEHATELLTVEIALVPGLLQTEDYAMAILRDENLVQQRLERQEVLVRGEPPLFAALLDESILYRQVGGPQVMAEQLDHLIAMIDRENVTIRVIPFTAEVCARFAGTFELASLDSGTHAAFIEGELSGHIAERPEDLSRLRRKWMRFSDEALSPRVSVELMRKAMSGRWPVT
jgi:transcriptional regulator with XRE-family HTH domain